MSIGKRAQDLEGAVHLPNLVSWLWFNSLVHILEPMEQVSSLVTCIASSIL